MAEDDALAIRAWNLMNATIDWNALPVIAEMFGIDDVEGFITRIDAIRTWKTENTD